MFNSRRRSFSRNDGNTEHRGRGAVKVTAGKGQWFLVTLKALITFLEALKGHAPSFWQLCVPVRVTLTLQLVAVYGLVEICSCSRVMANQMKRALANANRSSGNRISGGEVEQRCRGPRWSHEPSLQHQRLFGLGLVLLVAQMLLTWIQDSDRTGSLEEACQPEKTTCLLGSASSGATRGQEARASVRLLEMQSFEPGCRFLVHIPCRH